MSSGENERLAGRYRVVRQLGRGGMGIVWRAVDEVLGREVAVKELRTYNDASGPELDDLRLRMQREARAAARVRHPGVVAVHDVTEHQGRPVIVMELVDGPSLDGVLGERGTLPPREAARIGAAVLEALAAAHDVGVLHRDVKPGNVLLDRSGRIVLTDFGIAAMDDPGDGSATHLTRSGEIVGSLDYLAPERAQGQQPGPASDVWALGATLYAAVEGASPFRRTSTWSTLNAIVVEPLPEPRNAGPLTEALRQLLHKDPAQRPDARTAARLLTAVADGQDPAAPLTDGAGTVTAGPSGPSGPSAGHGGAPHLWVPTEPAAVPPPPGAGAGHAAAGATGPAGAYGFGGPHPYGTAGGPAAGPAAGPGAASGFGFGGPVPHDGTGGQGTVPTGGGPQGPAAPGPWPPAPAEATAAAAGGAAPHGVPAGATVPSRRAGRTGRRRSGALVAAAVAAVLLVGGGVTYALVGPGGGGTEREQLADGQAPAGPGADEGRVLDPGAPGTAGKATGSGSPSASASPSKDATKSASPSPSAKTSKAPLPGGTSGGTTGGSTGGSGGTGGATGGSTTTGGGGGGGAAPPPAPVCFSRGDGKYDCQVWRTEKTYSHGGGQMGVLNAGTNYFYCQANLGRRETYGQWTNVWWARTDDDSGNTNVYFSVVYLKGGDNDQPLPGLPVC
ncbi:serine/threonine-protein kinase [Streptomyces roseoviridis]|uniref:non-specific serine/threonine protein kinase n=1 Tax=Streptomyces roseoviridis TaxID=67361 RepID=A0ABV5QSC9_9ACTN